MSAYFCNYKQNLLKKNNNLTAPGKISKNPSIRYSVWNLHSLHIFRYFDKSPVIYYLAICDPTGFKPWPEFETSILSTLYNSHD